MRSRRSRNWNDSQKILTEARVQADQILSQTRSDANRVRDELKQKAQAEAAGILKNAERQIEMETARALQQIRSEAVDISVAIASKLLERNVSKEDNERLIEETFKQIEARKPS
jgi:F-type H+-transporting ATPase subunit b